MTNHATLAVAPLGYQPAYDLSIAEQVPARSSRSDERDDLRAARERRKAKHSRGLAALLSEREDLRGVYAPADIVHESLSWSA